MYMIYPLCMELQSNKYFTLQQIVTILFVRKFSLNILINCLIYYIIVNLLTQ